MTRRSKPTLLFVITCGFVAVASSCAGGAKTPGKTDAAQPTASITLPDASVVHVEIASDDATRAQGLMYRDRLPEDQGMIFLFPASGEYAFWMKNTIIPLDMVWIDEQNRIVHVAHDVPPCKTEECPSYPPRVSARYVLELAAGVAAKHHLANGGVLEFHEIDPSVAR